VDIRSPRATPPFFRVVKRPDPGSPHPPGPGLRGIAARRCRLQREDATIHRFVNGAGSAIFDYSTGQNLDRPARSHDLLPGVAPPAAARSGRQGSKSEPPAVPRPGAFQAGSGKTPRRCSNQGSSESMFVRRPDTAIRGRADPRLTENARPRRGPGCGFTPPINWGFQGISSYRPSQAGSRACDSEGPSERGDCADGNGSKYGGSGAGTWRSTALWLLAARSTMETHARPEGILSPRPPRRWPLGGDFPPPWAANTEGRAILVLLDGEKRHSPQPESVKGLPSPRDSLRRRGGALTRGEAGRKPVLKRVVPSGLHRCSGSPRFLSS